MPKEEYTVVYDIQAAGSPAPAVWAEKKLKIVNAAGETKEKNESGVNRGTGVPKTTVPQNAKIVTIIAESAEEAVLAVQKYYSQGGQFAVEAKQLESAVSTNLPAANTLIRGGKWMASVATEVAVR